MLSKLKIISALLAGLAAGLCLVDPAAAVEKSAWWGDLEPGPYEVGFTTHEMFDYSRTLGPSDDYFGAPRVGENARPIQVCVWYPAVHEEGEYRRVYSEYTFPAPVDDQFFTHVSLLQAREINALFMINGGDQARVNEAMNVEVAAVRDAVAAEGTFPLVVFHPDLRGAYCQNAELCEYLAAHGMIVATSHAVGTATVNTDGSPADLETAVRDREMVTGFMRDFPNVDHTRVAVIGIGSGALSALIHEMKNPDIDAVVSLNGAFAQPDRVELCREDPYFDPAQMQVPMLYMSADTLPNEGDNILDSLVYSRRLVVVMDGAQRMDLSHYAVIASSMGDTTRPRETVFRNYATVCRYVLDFLKAELADDETARAFFAGAANGGGNLGNVAITEYSAQEAPPTPVEFTEVLQTYGVDRALELSEKFNLADPDHPVLPEGNLNIIAYGLMQRGNLEDAIKLFAMIARAYPNSANAWDSYGEGCMTAGNYQLALANYEKALELLPSDSTINPALRNAIEANAPGRIETLKRLVAEQAGGGEQDASD